MLQVSEKAAAALETIRRNEEIPESHNTRLGATRSPEGDLALRLHFVEEAEEGDQVAEQAGTELYVDSALAEPLSDSVMEVESTEEGLTFVFRNQTQES